MRVEGKQHVISTYLRLVGGLEGWRAETRLLMTSLGTRYFLFDQPLRLATLRSRVAEIHTSFAWPCKDRSLYGRALWFLGKVEVLCGPLHQHRAGPSLALKSCKRKESPTRSPAKRQRHKGPVSSVQCPPFHPASFLPLRQTPTTAADPRLVCPARRPVCDTYPTVLERVLPPPRLLVSLPVGHRPVG